MSKIDLEGYDQLSHEQIAAFVTAMSASRVKKLELYHAYSFDSESKHALFINMLSSNSSIEGLTLSNIFKSQNMQQLAVVLPQSKIKKLKLIRIRLTDDAIMILANVLPKTQVEVLYLSYAHISTLGVRHLADALTNSKVKRLSLANNQGIHAIDISILASMLPSTKLEELDLTGKRINSIGVQALAAVLPNTKLKKINLSQNPIDDNAVLALASVLPNSHVEEIHLCSDDIQITGVNAIIKVLASSRIKRLYLGSSNITPKFTQDIAIALQNSQVEEFHLYSKKVPLPQAVAFIRKLVNTPVKIVGLKFGSILHQSHPSMLTDALKTTNIRKVFLSRTVGKIDPLLQLQFKRCTAPLNIEWVFNANERY